MHQEDTKRRLIEIAASVRQGAAHGHRIECLLMSLGLNWQQVIEAIITYTCDLNTLDNGFYEHPASRLALYIHNLVENSYHRHRAKVTASYLSDFIDAGARRIIDIGFGVPGLYLEYLLERERRARVTLVDRDPGCISFADAVFRCLPHPECVHGVEVLVHDMNVETLKSNYDVYMFMDSIEHATNPTVCLTHAVSVAHAGAGFILALPIGHCEMAMHFAEWPTVGDAQRWIKECGLQPEREELLYPVPGVDLFAEMMGGHFANLLVSCRKARCDGATLKGPHPCVAPP